MNIINHVDGGDGIRHRYETTITVVPGFIKYMCQNPESITGCEVYEPEKYNEDQNRISGINPGDLIFKEFGKNAAFILCTRYVTFLYAGTATVVSYNDNICRWLEISSRANELYSREVYKCEAQIIAKSNEPTGITSGQRPDVFEMSDLLKKMKPISMNPNIMNPDMCIITNKSREIFYMSKQFHTYLKNRDHTFTMEGRYTYADKRFHFSWSKLGDVHVLDVKYIDSVGPDDTILDFLKQSMEMYRGSSQFESY